jgi:PAS domain-containing protein
MGGVAAGQRGRRTTLPAPHLPRVRTRKDKFQQVIIYVVRITETKEFEEKVRLHEKRYRDLFNHSQALICTHDMDGKLLTVNPATCKILQLRRTGEMLGRNIRDMIPDKHRPRFEEEYLGADA